MKHILLILGIISFTSISYSQNASITPDLVDDDVKSKTKGTFQFESATGDILFWTEDFIESLYPEIISRREQSETVYWQYNDDMTIVIFSRELINDESFTPLNSPYNGGKIPE